MKETQEALAACAAAYTGTMNQMRQHYRLRPGQLPDPNQNAHIRAVCEAAYRTALPTLAAAQLPAFLACIAQGVAIDAFTGRQATQLLYAAQVCASASRNTERTNHPPTPRTRAKRPRTCNPPTPPKKQAQ